MAYRTPSSYELRWIEYLPEVGEPILDELEAFYKAEKALEARQIALIETVKSYWTYAQRRRARQVAKRCPATQPTPSEFIEIATAR